MADSLEDSRSNASFTRCSVLFGHGEHLLAGIKEWGLDVLHIFGGSR